MRAISLFAALAAGVFLTAAAPAVAPSAVADAIANPARPAEDRAADARRKPADMLAFAEVKPGDVVVDLIPGKYYFTRLFAKAVGPTGSVYFFTPSELQPFYKEPLPVTGARPQKSMPNAIALTAPLAAFSVPNKADVVWTSQNYHDLHTKRFGPANVAKFNKAVFDALKPGGVYIVLDHAAASGAGLESAEDLHRIDPALVKSEVLAAGFIFAGELDVVRHPDDPHTAKVFDPAIRGKTDQFVLKFRKPS